MTTSRATRTADGITVAEYMTAEGSGYQVRESQEFTFWRQQFTYAVTMGVLVAPPAGKDLQIYGIIMESGYGNIYVYNRAPDGTPTLVADSTVSNIYTFSNNAPVVIRDNGWLGVSVTPSGPVWVMAYGIPV